MMPSLSATPRPSPNQTPAFPPDTAEMISGVLAGVLGRRVTSAKVAPSPLTRRAARITAAYLNAEGVLISLCTCDLSFAAYAGAALLMVPAGVAKESIAAGKCTPDLVENVGEILNILRQCFEAPGHHVAAAKVHPDPDKLPPEIATLLATPHQRLDLEIAISSYGNGRLSVLV